MSNGNFKEKHLLDHLLTNVPVVSPTTTVRQALRLIRDKQRWDTINYVYVIDEKKELLGVLSIKELLRTADDVVVSHIMTHQPVGIVASAKEERASIVAIAKNIKAVPVFKLGTREFLGVVGSDEISSLLHHEHIEDILRFSGIARSHRIVDIFKAPVATLVKARAPWLLVGLLGGMVGAALVSQFETVLEKEIALAFFIPVVVYISDAVGTQTETLLLRLLGIQKVNPLRFIRKELLVTVVLAFLSATMIGIYAWFWLQSPLITLVVVLAIALSTVTSAMIATVIPLCLYALKKDPAFGSGPFATAIQDVASLLIYFLIATAIIL